MGIANPIETIIGILTVIDQVRAKMEGTPLADFPWRPASPGPPMISPNSRMTLWRVART